MTSFVLKVIAIITMTLDHLGYAIYGKFSVFNYFGRIAFPIFAYQISEGYKYTKDIKKYFSRLFLFALISEIPFFLFCKAILGELDYIPLNIFFSLCLGLLCIFIYDKMKEKIFSFFIIAIICYLGELINVDYGYWGVLLIFIFYLFKDNKVLTIVSFLIMCLIKYYEYIFVNFDNIKFLSCIFTFSAIIPLILYNGKLGLKTKYILYIYYPTHLLLLYIFTVIC